MKNRNSIRFVHEIPTATNKFNTNKNISVEEIANKSFSSFPLIQA